MALCFGVAGASRFRGLIRPREFQVKNQREDSMYTTMRLSMLAATALLFVGVNGSVQAQQAQQAPNTTFFVTSVGLGKGADLGGLAGADAQCQALATTIG